MLAGAVAGSAADSSTTCCCPSPATPGPPCAPFNAWVVLKGLETLDLRVRRQSENALKVGRFLEQRVPQDELHRRCPAIPQHNLAPPPDGCGGPDLLVRGRWRPRTGATRLLDALELVDISNNIGDSRSLMTASGFAPPIPGVAEEKRVEMGVTEGMLRLNVGLEGS